MKVEAIMRRSVVTVRPETPLRDVARILVEHAISGVPVVDAAGAVLGVVSEADFVLKEQGLPEPRHRLLPHLLGDASERAIVKVEATTAGEAMTSPPLTVEPAATVRDAARLMTEGQVNRLPVVLGGRLVGIVTRSDIVRSFMRSDEELREAILSDVVRGEMWLDESAVDVEVSEGVASIGGTVDKRSDVAILERLVSAMPGLMGCRVAVDWRLDDTDIEPEPPDLVNPPFGPA